MNLKRVLLFSILFLLLSIGLLYYGLLNIPNPLRIDKIPTGAYIVPWMQPNPSITELPYEFSIDSVMAGALKLSMTFNITMWDNTTRVIPSTVYLGHDAHYLYVGGQFVGMYSNPASTSQGLTEVNFFAMYFDVANSGLLKTPEAGTSLGASIDVPSDFLGTSVPEDVLWAYSADTYQHMIWMPADVYLMNRGGQSFFSTAESTCRYDNTTGTVTMLFARSLSIPQIANIDALQMRQGERWAMGFLMELGFDKPLDSRVDGWPQTTYLVWSNDSSWWPKLVIDLTNPPKPSPSATIPSIQT
jgi:hypothetical protein